MTGDELRTLDDLLGKFRTAHAPMWIRPHVSALRRLARTLAGDAPDEPELDATVLVELVRWMAGGEQIRFEDGELQADYGSFESEWYPLTWDDVPDHLIAPLQAVFGVVLPGPVHGPPSPPRPPWRQGFHRVDLTYEPIRTGVYRPAPDLRFSSLAALAAAPTVGGGLWGAAVTRDELVAELRKKGRDVPDGDGWGWEFEPDPWAAAAADMLEADSDLLAAIARADHEPADEPGEMCVYMPEAVWDRLRQAVRP